MRNYAGDMLNDWRMEMPRVSDNDILIHYNLCTVSK